MDHKTIQTTSTSFPPKSILPLPPCPYPLLSLLPSSPPPLPLLPSSPPLLPLLPSSPAPPSITALFCPDLENPENGQVTLTNRLPGSVATYTCDAGFILIGSQTRSCQNNGFWSGIMPLCQRKRRETGGREGVGEIVSRMRQRESS